LTRLQHVAGATRTWEAAGRPDSELYRGARLEAALEALPDRAGELTESETEYLHAGQAARDAGHQRERRTARRLRLLLAGVVLALVASLIAGSIAVTQSRRADGRTTEARRRALIAAADSLRGTQRDLAVLLAAEADRLAPSADSRSALFGSFTDSIGLLGYRWFDEGIAPTVDITTLDDSSVAVLDSDLALWSVPIGGGSDRSVRLLEARGNGTGLLATDADRGVLAIYRDDGSGPAGLAIYDIGTPRLVTEVDVAAGRTNLAVSPDGVYVGLAGGPDGGAEVRLATDASSVGSIPTPGVDAVPGAGESAAVAFTASGSILVGTLHGDVEVHRLPGLELTGRLPADPNANGPPTARLVMLAGDESVVGHGTMNGDLNRVGSSITRWDLSGDAPTWTSDQHNSGCNDLVEVPATDELWCATSGAARAIDLRTGATRDVFVPQHGPTPALALLPDGRRLLAGSSSAPVAAVLDAAGGGPITAAAIVTSRDLAPSSCRSDGRFLTAENKPNTPDDWALIDLTTGEVDDPLDQVGLGAAWTGSSFLGYIGTDGAPYRYDPATQTAELIEFPPLEGTIDLTTNDPAHDRVILWMSDGQSFWLDPTRQPCDRPGFRRAYQPQRRSAPTDHAWR
jgi:hypothetical protein